MIASLDSVESLCDFSYLEHDEAFQKDEKRGASSGFRGAVRHGARHFGRYEPASHDLVSE